MRRSIIVRELGEWERFDYPFQRFSYFPLPLIQTMRSSIDHEVIVAERRRWFRPAMPVGVLLLHNNAIVASAGEHSSVYDAMLSMAKSFGTLRMLMPANQSAQLFRRAGFIARRQVMINDCEFVLYERENT